MARLRCLIVDDEADARDIFRRAVVAACPDIDIDIDEAGTYEEAQKAVAQGRYAIALIDCNLKGKDVDSFQGLGVARDLSEAGCDVLLISGMTDQSLPIMADDIANAACLLKPRKLADLAVEVRRALRNRESRPPPRSELPPGLEVDPASSHRLFWHGNRVQLGHVPYDIAMYLARRHGSLVTYDELIKCCISGGKSALFSHIRHIKENFERDGRDFQAIRNVSGRGYIWES